MWCRTLWLMEHLQHISGGPNDTYKSAWLESIMTEWARSLSGCSSRPITHRFLILDSFFEPDLLKK